MNLNQVIDKAELARDQALAEERWNTALQYHALIQQALDEKDQQRTARMREQVNNLLSWTGIQL